MQLSARNAFAGTVSAVTAGLVNGEVELTMAGDERIVAIVTMESVRALGLRPGRAAVAYVKAPWVMLLAGSSGGNFSARNQFAGEVVDVRKGAFNSEVVLLLPGGTMVCAVVSHEAVLELGLKPGVAATALIKASQVVLGVSA